MNILDSIVEGALALPSRRDSDALIGAVVRFMATGEEPELSGVPAAMWMAVRPAVENSRAKSAAGKRGGRQSAKQNGKQSAKQNEKQSAKQMESKGASEQVSSSSSFSSSLSDSPSGRFTFRDDVPAPPTLDDVRAYFSCNCLRGDPAEFFDHFESQGWLRANGLPISDWMAQARQWSRKQIEFDQSKPVEARAPEKPMPRADNAIDWEAEAAMLDMEGADDGWRG